MNLKFTFFFACALSLACSLCAQPEGFTTILSPDFAAYQNFGNKVMVRGNRLLVADAESGDITPRKVYLFEKDASGNYELSTVFNQPEGPDNYRYGNTLAMTDEFIIIAAENYDYGLGRVYIYKNINGTWEEQPFLEPDGPNDEAFGTSLSVDGDYLMVGAPEYGFPNPGGAYFYKLINGTWTFQQKITPDVHDHEGLANNGSSMYGDRAAMTSRSQERVHVYKRTGETWELEQILENVYNTHNSSDGSFGYHTSIYENRMAVAYRKDDEFGEDKGSVVIYKRTGTQWDVETKIAPPVDLMGGAGGFSYQLDMQGDMLVVGTNGSGEQFEGKMFLYVRKGAEWELQDDYTGAIFEGFGRTSLDLGESTIVAGARANSDTEFLAGAAYVRQLPVLRPQISNLRCNSGGTTDPSDDFLDFDLTVVGENYPTADYEMSLDGYSVSPSSAGLGNTVAVSLEAGSAEESFLYLKMESGIADNDFYYAEIESPGTCSMTSVFDAANQMPVEVRPNPVVNEVVFSFPDYIDTENYQIILTDLHGKELMNRRITNHNLLVDLSNLPTGMLYWRLQSVPEGSIAAAGQIIKK